MVSSDKNVDTVVKLIDALKRWTDIKAEYLKIDAADKGVRILSALIFIVFFLFFSFTISILLAIAIAFAISTYIGHAWGFVIMAVAYMLAFLLIIIMRKQWIYNPLVRFLSAIMNK